AVTNRSNSALSRDTTLSQVTFQATAGTVYQIAVDGEVGTLRTLRLTVARTLPPLVVLTSPANGSEFMAGDTVRGIAEAFDPDGRASAVDFILDNAYGGYENTTTVRAGPFWTTWPDLEPGSYQLTARGVDDLGAKADAIPVTFNVRPWNDNFGRRI